jgi:hypothetical protein
MTDHLKTSAGYCMGCHQPPMRCDCLKQTRDEVIKYADLELTLFNKIVGRIGVNGIDCNGLAKDIADYIRSHYEPK